MKSSMAKAAADDESIVKQVSDKGDVSYVRKEVCPMSGKVTMKQVEYCSKSAKFVNVSPTGAKQACSKKASATKVSSTSKKACSGQKAASKACCKKGAKACSKKASTQKAAAPAKAKMVKGEASSH
jgi:hypothetical protein